MKNSDEFLFAKTMIKNNLIIARDALAKVSMIDTINFFDHDCVSSIDLMDIQYFIRKINYLASKINDEESK